MVMRALLFHSIVYPMFLLGRAGRGFASTWLGFFLLCPSGVLAADLGLAEGWRRPWWRPETTRLWCLLDEDRWSFALTSGPSATTFLVG